MDGLASHLAVGVLHEDYEALVADLSSSPSGLTALNRSFHKHLLVAAASSLEERVKRITIDLFRDHGSIELSKFVEVNVMVRSYHSLFAWKEEKAAPFFASFGEQCISGFKEKLSSDDDMKNEHDAFMRLGNLRNQVVHNDYATFPISLTPDDVISLYKMALAFTERIEDLVFRIER
ncbi:hypothetical protein IFU11_17705 [Plantibacter sp. CFBP 8804]|nr:hypothetical protein [Plantibacter sp. CFBP 8804]